MTTVSAPEPPRSEPGRNAGQSQKARASRQSTHSEPGLDPAALAGWLMDRADGRSVSERILRLDRHLGLARVYQDCQRFNEQTDYLLEIGEPAPVRTDIDGSVPVPILFLRDGLRDEDETGMWYRALRERALVRGLESGEMAEVAPRVAHDYFHQRLTNFVRVMVLPRSNGRRAALARSIAPPTQRLPPVPPLANFRVDCDEPALQVVKSPEYALRITPEAFGDVLTTPVEALLGPGTWFFGVTSPFAADKPRWSSIVYSVPERSRGYVRGLRG